MRRFTTAYAMPMPARRRLLLLPALALTLAACGADQTSGSAVEKVVRDDWDGASTPEADAHWPGRPELDGSSVEDVSCPDRPVAGGRMRCRVQLDTRATVTVEAEFGDSEELVRWRVVG